MTILILILLVIVILLFLLSMLWPPDSPWSPWWRTTTQLARIECKLAKVKKGDVIYDLGCGDGTALTIAAKEFGASGVGIEIDPFRAWIAKIKVKIFGVSDRIEIRRDSFWNQDITDATVIFMYLIPKTLVKLRTRFLKELKPGTRVVTFVYKMDLPLIAEDKKAELYCYEIPKKK
ncbi:MAG TPA: 50S ribosomal protein L11 methyltransferase [Candidatus Saccharimonadales bacterium]|nr:50S ribosomal protein L11 methyltransferase [Candidatus Saccharimonadales bacterium]